MAKMRIGTKTVTPVRNIPSYHGDDIIEILNNEDLSNALDGKVDKVSAPSVFYGTDYNGSQTTYDLSLLLDTETSPDGYTDVEYISSGDESTKSVRIRDYHAETSSFMGFEIVDAGKFMDYFNTVLARRYDYPITCVKFQVENPSISGAPMLWFIYVNGAGSSEPTMRNGGSVYEEPYDGMDSIEQRWGIRPIYSDTTSREEGDSGTFDIYEVNATGQYIDTGLVFENYEYGHAKYDRENSQVEQYFQTWWVENKGAATQTTINQMSSLTGKDITRMKFVMTRTQSSTSMTLYAVDSEGNETSFNTFANDTACQDACGITMTWSSLNDGDYVYYDYYPKTIDTWGIETSLKISDQELTNTSNYICGSMSMYGQFGCGLICTENDGILFKHYKPNAQNGFRVPYNKGNWNKIKMEPGTFTLNGESFEVSTDATIHTVSGKTFILFGITREDGVKASGMSMKKTKIYKNGILVFNGIPCVEDSSGIAGMYDLVTQQFFKSAKEGSEFIAGPLYEAEDRLNLGVKGTDVILGLNKEGNISTYSGKNGIVIESIIGLDDYEELEYIESTDGNLAFNTQRSWGMSGTTMTSTKWEITYYQTYTSAESGGKRCQYVFGDGMFADMGQNFNRIDFRFYDGQGSFPYTSTSGNRGAMSADGIFMEELETWNTFAFDYQTLYLNDKVIKSLDYPIAQVVHSKNFHIFTAPDAISTGSFGDGFIGRISNVKEFSSNTTLSNFVPVRRKSDNEIGFYDTVNGIFCQNIGEGTPVAGPAKTGTISLEKPLDSFLANIATQKDTSLMVTTPTVPGSSTVKNLDGSSDLVIGPYGEITDGGSNSIAINGKVTGSGAIVIGKNSSISAGHSVVVGNEVEVDGSNSVVVGYSGTSSTSFKVGSYSVILGNEIQTAKRSGVVAIGHHAYAYNGDNLVAIGYSAASYGNLSVSIGYGAQSLNSYCVVLGANARTNGDYGIAIGNTSSNADENRTLASTSAIAIGSNARAESNSVSIGHLTKANGGNSVNIGTQSTIPYGSTIVIGYGATVSGGDCGVGIGVNSQTSSGGVAVGYNTKSYGNNSVAIGFDAYVNGEHGVAIGYNAKDTTGYNVAIGRNAQASNNNAVAIGSGAKSVGGGGIAIGEAASAKNRAIAIGGMTAAETDTAIVVGHAAKASNVYALGLGYGTHAKNMRSVALGYQAKSYANDSIQLGEGTNSNASTLQFRGYPLVGSDGIIPYERLTPYAPTNGYVLAWSTSTNSLVWVENGEGGGGYELPIASASTLGGVKIGEGLQINPNTGVLSVTGGQSGEGEGVWGQIEGNIEDQTDLMNILNSKFTQTLEMPKASTAYNGKTLQFLGITDLLYTHGYVYECQYKRISSLTGSTSDSTRFTVTFDAPRFEAYFKEYHPEIDLRDNTNYFIQYVSSTSKWTFYISGEGDIGIYIDTYNLPYVGINVSYIGQNEPEEEDQVNMVYYPASDEEHAPFGYIWNRLNVQPHVEVIDSVTSSSTTDALSANQGRVLQEQIDTLSSIGQFLAIWDCNKNGHNARYLADGYQYSIGNYFIVGAVEEWNYDPDKGPVTVSFDTNNHVAISGGYTTTWDELKLYNRYKPTTDATFKFTWNVSSQKWYDETKHTYLDAGSLLSTIGFCPSHNAKEVQAADLVEGDYFEVVYTHTHNYFPVGDTYYEAPDAGCVRTYEDIQVSDMIFYDGQNWVLLANHSKQTAVDHDLDPASTNPVENATVTAALNSKVSTTSDGNRVYGTTALGEQVALELGENLTITGGVIDTDISGKQDTLVSGENIKTINGESILGSGNIIIQGGSGMGTIAITDIFTRPGYVEDQGYDEYRQKAWFHGNYENILFTTNADYDYLKANKEDLYVTISQRKHHGGKRRFNVCNDDRVKTNMKLHCWRMFTNKRWNFEYLGWETDFIPDLDAQQYENNGYQISDLNYVYFYTKEDYGNDPDTMVSANPVVYFAVTRIDPYNGKERPDNDLPTTFEESYINGGNWGTSFNEIYCEGDHLTDYKIFGKGKGYKKFERISDYDITEFINSCSNSWNRPSEEMGMDKMKGRSYELNGNKYYFWCNDWTDSGADVLAHLDDNDDPIPNSVPEDKSLISSFTTVGDLDDYTLIEERPDLRWYMYGPSYSESDLQNFCEYAHGVQTDVDPDNDKLDYKYGSVYKYDYPIQPRRISQCKILMTDKAPWSKVWDEDEGKWVYPADKYNDYLNHAYTIDEIESNEDLRYLIAYQKRIILVFPYTTAHFWMRSFGWQSETYRRMQMEIKRQSYYWESTEWGGQWTCDNYDEGGNPVVEDYTLQAMPEDRHSLAAYFWKCWCLGDQSYSVYDEDSGESVKVRFECFRDLLGFIGNREYSPRWNPNDMNKVYWMPVQFNICTGRDVSYNLKSQSTPIDKKMTITGSKHSNGHAGINGISQNVIS